MSEREACRVDGCSRVANRVSYQLCEMHYYRLRRNGSTGIVRQRKPQLEHSSGYVIIYAHGHPLTHGLAGSYTYEHRVVFYDNHGPGPFSCNWCGVEVTWETMHVDHVNAAVNDNRIENLVASCPGCNRARGTEKMKSTMRRTRARLIEWNGEALTAGEWADRLGVARFTVEWRLKAGWPLARALTEPRGKFGPRSKHRAA